MKNAYKILDNLKGKGRDQGTVGRITLKMDLRETGCKSMNWIQVGQDTI
jgi:hypothetical protein